ncbi:LysM peptidoglycan-binding domain-containing protein [Rheinheimera riviphila]|uniref:LysM peptidoglycan-binding domain-containing protein n=1 Tax=Rheinheimera riviphila TaxID=1834037 RepID=A0A437QRQ2_9GAMM|nr:LysM peptidoglycan-binding domain-containing protein [Rheinheimera riviphila]RVU37184.1 LysM peptidoglycan-binding domain-containing protein [Rheinheimera riviphila]
MKKLLLILLLVWLNGCVNQPKTDTASTSPVEPQQQAGTTVAISADRQSVPLAIDASEQSLSELPDVWLRIQQQIQIEVPNTLDVSQQRDFYRRHQSLLNQVSVRAEPFLYHIVVELERRKMPVELALLPIVESSFNPVAQAGAPAGLWQMVPQTARNFGLQRNDWYDGRKDPIASTNAALDYLQYLYNNLGQDWLNAVAGFNSGEGRVQKAIAANQAKGKAIDFWSLNLPKQSTIYLPKWLALIDLLQHAEKYQMKWPAIANQPAIGFTSIKGPVDLNQVAQLTQLSLSDIKTLNPGFRRSYTAHGEHTLVLPLSKMALFAQNRPQLRAVRLTETRQYRVKSGDSLGLIASKNGTTVAKLKQLNQLKSDQLKVGQQLFLSLAATAPSTVPSKVRKSAASKQAASYKVKSGDNLWLIAKQFKVDGAALAKYNKLSANSRLKPGQTLKIPAAKEKVATVAANKNRVYVVKSGDSLDKIAKKQKVKLADLLKWNTLTTESMLQPGQKLQLK